MRGKDGMEMAISTIILIILGIFILAGLIFLLVHQFDFFKENVFDKQSKSNVDDVVSVCNSLVTIESAYSYCCEVRKIKTSDAEVDLTCAQSAGAAWAGGRIKDLDCSATIC